jgi:hypothetical protein
MYPPQPSLASTPLSLTGRELDCANLKVCCTFSKNLPPLNAERSRSTGEVPTGGGVIHVKSHPLYQRFLIVIINQ